MAYEAVDRVLDSSSIVAAFLFQKASINEGINFCFASPLRCRVRRRRMRSAAGTGSFR
jgi:hypothetical protein